MAIEIAILTCIEPPSTTMGVGRRKDTMTGEREGTRSATGRFAPVAGAVLLGLTIVLAVVGTALLFGGGDFGRVPWGLPGAAGLWALGFSGAGYPITRRHPENPVGWSLMVAGVASGVAVLGTGVPAADPDGPVLLLMNFWVVSVAALCTAVVLFPSGSPPSRWWWAFLGVVWGSGCLEYFRVLPPSQGFAFLPERLDALAAPTHIVFQFCLGVQFLALVARWRRSGAVERLQLKWVVYGVTLAASTALVVEVGLANLFPVLYVPGTYVLSVLVLVAPASMGVAMFRYRLYDIDVVIYLTLVYGALSATLALLYFGGIVLSQRIFSGFTGHDKLPQLAIVASTLAIAALFNPLRRRIQELIDRRFYRSKYDARNTLTAFSKKLRDETDLDVLGEDLVGVVRNTMQPEHVSLWLREPSGATKPKADG
jgi:hypothetical protein